MISFIHRHLHKHRSHRIFHTPHCHPDPPLFKLHEQLTMYDLKRAQSIVNAAPSVCVSSGSFDSAVKFYEVCMCARVTMIEDGAILDSAYGFRVEILRGDSKHSRRCRALLCLQSSVDHAHQFCETLPAARMAYALCGGGRVKSSRKGLYVKDRFGVRWTVA